VPRKSKVSQEKISEELNSGLEPSAPATDETRRDKNSTRRSSSASRKAKPAQKKNRPRARPKARSVAEPADTADLSDEAIRIRAYFISERRRRLALPGDAESDWLEAKRQLLSESERR
jgi:hypothetical protein